MNNSFDQAAKECARYIFDSDCEQISYQEFINDGNDPRDHILYHAAVVLDIDKEEFHNDIEQYLEDHVAK
jgi:hypothetical protein